jgi:hypothetical protein
LDNSQTDVYFGYLGSHWWLFGAGYPTTGAAQLAWYDERRAALGISQVHGIWLQHDCATAAPSEALDERCDNAVHDRAALRIAISGHWCCGMQRRAWGLGPTLRDANGDPDDAARTILKVYSNDQQNRTLLGWTTELRIQLGGKEVCLEAFHPVTRKRGYEHIAGNAYTGRAASPPRECFTLDQMD